MEPKATKEIMDFNATQNEKKVSSFKFSSISCLFINLQDALFSQRVLQF